MNPASVQSLHCNSENKSESWHVNQYYIEDENFLVYFEALIVMTVKQWTKAD
jgi:hypothetical protein